MNLSIPMNYGIIRIFPFHGKFLFERY